MITITRGKAYSDRLRKYNVVLDGNVIGKISEGQSISYNENPGTHTLRIRIDWGGSNEIKFKSVANDTIKFRCASRAQGLKILLGIIYATVLSQRYIELELID